MRRGARGFREINCEGRSGGLALSSALKKALAKGELPALGGFGLGLGFAHGGTGSPSSRVAACSAAALPVG